MRSAPRSIPRSPPKATPLAAATPARRVRRPAAASAFALRINLRMRKDARMASGAESESPACQSVRAEPVEARAHDIEAENLRRVRPSTKSGRTVTDAACLVLRGLFQHLLNLGVELRVRHRADHAHALKLVVFQIAKHERRRSLDSGHTAFGDVLVDLRLEL